MEQIRTSRTYLCAGIIQMMFLHSLAVTVLTIPTDCPSFQRPSFWLGVSPSLPSLPAQYSMKVEANILQNSWTTEVEEHYDSINQRASVSLTRNGSTTISIFNFKDAQRSAFVVSLQNRYDIYPNGTCVAQPSSADFVGFVTINKQNRPVMSTVNEVFRFGTQFNVTYVGQEKVRGITVNHWTSCQFWTSFGTKFQLDYYFTDPDFTTAGGCAEIPVRAVLNGSAHNVNTSNDQIKGMHTFQHIYEFTSFRAGSVLNEDVFQIPPGVFCRGRIDNRPFPTIPDQIAISIEIIGPDSNIPPKEEYLRYDFKHRLQETITTSMRDVGLNMDKSHNSNLMATSTSVIKDYQYGLVYSTKMTNMECVVQKMSTDISSPTLSMLHGENLFEILKGSNKFVYQGEKILRNIPVSAWAMELQSVVTEVYFLAEDNGFNDCRLVGMIIKNTTLIDTTGLSKIICDNLQSKKLSGSEHNAEDREEISPSLDRLTGDQIVQGKQLKKLLDQHISQEIINIFHYNNVHLDIANFQVSHCYQQSETSQIVLFILADYDKDVRCNFLGFINSLRNTLAQKIGCSLLHISNLALSSVRLISELKNSTKATFNLLGSTPVHVNHQKSLSEVKEHLKIAITNGISFHITCPAYSKDFNVHKTIYFIDSFPCQTQDSINGTVLRQSQSSTDEMSKFGSSETRYSQGAVAGIAVGSLVLGILLCLGSTFLAHTWRKPRDLMVEHEDTM